MDIKLTQREICLQAMKERPNDPWPKGDGHVILAEPGSPREQKGYHEPGGLFSPAPGSFGVSFWILDSKGNRIKSTEELDKGEIKQEYSWQKGKIVPSINTVTPYYSCSWSLVDGGNFRCDLKMKQKMNTCSAIVFRSIGPAGSPLESIFLDGSVLTLNHRWTISFETKSQLKVYLGNESLDELDHGKEISSFESPNGWAFAKVEFSNEPITILIHASAPSFKSPLSFSSVKSCLKMDLPSKEFKDSLDAQAANLMMGFIGKQTCPGEPTNYPLAWERDGAYSVIAMARCGQIETAKELCVHFAENDFFGGFGPEADAPGSAINALVETALISGDKEFQLWIWPHILRKASIIRKMYEAKSTIRKTWTGPIVPSHRGKDIIPIICETAKDGLINGTMDLHFPLLYINAVSRRGLVQASKIAVKLGEDHKAIEFANFADDIRKAWLKNFSRKDLYNDRNFISAIWPTWTIGPDHAQFRDALQKRWDDSASKGFCAELKLWSYFNVAETHQWLLLGDTKKVWTTLRYFWENQCSPGLYTYWEGNGEENSFGLWKDIRGWLKPKHITPHYWTAAEMLLLQLDMLAYIDESKKEPELVIGAGTPKEWLSKPMQVEGIHTSLGKVGWSYSNDLIKVRIHEGRRCKVRAGYSFPKGTRTESIFN